MNVNRNMYFTLILRHSQTLNIYEKDRHCWDIIDRPTKQLIKRVYR